MRLEPEPILLWLYIDKNVLPWKSYGYYSDGSYYSGVKRIGCFKLKALKIPDHIINP